MKAQARKILALIMAMVMCMSLAAPAFAEAEEAAAESSAPAAVEVEETEAPEEEKEEEQAPEAQEAKEEKKDEPKLEKQEAVIYAFIYGGTSDNYKPTDDGFVVIANDGANNALHRYPDSGRYKWTETDKYPNFVELKGTTPVTTNTYIGTQKKTKYTVGVKSDFVDSTDTNDAHKTTIEWLVNDTPEVKYALTDSNIAWATLTNEQDWFTLNAPANGLTAGDYQVKGSIYQEAQANGKYRVFFKLTPTVSGLGEVFDTASSAKPIYLVKDNDTKLTTNAQIRAFLSGLAYTNVTNIYGETSGLTDGTDGYKNCSGTEAKNWSVAINGEDKRIYTYDVFDVTGEGLTVTPVPSNVSSTPFQSGSLTIGWTGGKAVTGSFKVKATYDANLYNSNPTAITAEKDLENVKNALTKIANGTTASPSSGDSSAWTVVSVTGPDSSDYFTVSIARKNKADGDADNVDATGIANADNVSIYTVNGYKKAGLTDLSANGYYWGIGADTTDPNAKTPINANTKLYGPVYVAKADMPEEVTKPNGTALDEVEDAKGGKGYVFPTEEVMKATLTNQSCAEAKTVKFTKLVMNAQDTASKENKGVKNSGGIFVAETEWWTVTGAFVEKDQSWTIAKSTNHKYLEQVTVVPGTCKVPGSETREIKCKYCGDVKSTETKPLPVDQSAAQKRTTENHGYNFYNSNDNLIAGAPSSAHYIKYEKITTTLKTKETKGSIKHEYVCSHGEIHDELTWTEETDKEALIYSGRWDNLSWGTQNTAEVKNPGALYGFTATICDTDLEETSLPLNGDYKHFVFATATSLTDGTYYGVGKVEGKVGNVVEYNAAEDSPAMYVAVVSKDANGNKITVNTWYKANVIVKDIKLGAKDCVDGSATIELNIYKVSNDSVKITPEKLEESLKNKTAELAVTYTKQVVVPAEKTHVDANNDGLCDNCGGTIEQSAVNPTGKTDISKAVVEFGALTYSGTAKQPKVTVTLDGVKLAKGVDYEVEEMQDTDAGTYTLIVAGKGNFEGRATGEVTINQAASSMKIKSQPKTLTSKKKEDVTGQVKMKYTNSKLDKFAVATKLAGVSINKKTGKITVKKTIKKAGTFKFKVTGKAKNTNFTAPKAVTGKVTIKLGKK